MTVIESHTLRLVMADDHTMLREGLRRSLVERGLDVVAEAADGEEAVRMANLHRPDVVLMDVSMPILDGVEATRQVRLDLPDTQVVMLTMHADHDVLGRAIRAGAAGYLVKDCTIDEVVRTIEQAAAGTALSPEFAGAMLAEAIRTPLGGASATGEPIISKREEEVLQLIAEGHSTTEVAAQLFISVKTVKNHLGSVYQKLDSRDRTQAVVRAVKMGIIRIS
jgi:DNA-binding NarL/FixJ family response regulator